MIVYQQRKPTALPPQLADLTQRTLGACIEVHRALGPGLLESVYELCLAAEFEHRNMPFRRQVPIPVAYRNVSLESGFRLDFVIEDELVVEIKAVETVLDVHRAQLASYLKLANRPVGLLINFNVPVLRQGVKRILNPAHEGLLSRQS